MRLSLHRCRGLLFFLATGLLLVGCQTADVNPEQVRSGVEYFPAKVGQYWIYRIDTVVYTPEGASFSGSFFRKEKISDTLPDQEGSKVYRVEISKATDTTAGWEIDSIWSFRLDAVKLLYTENNRPLVKLKFPLQDGSRWDGNAYNTEADSSGIFWYSVANMQKPFTLPDSTAYPETVTVLQRVDDNSINKSNFYEVYGKNIGLIYREKTFLIYKSPASPEIGAGASRKQSLIRFGIE